jgi:hypothetical protein
MKGKMEEGSEARQLRRRIVFEFEIGTKMNDVMME